MPSHADLLVRTPAVPSFLFPSWHFVVVMQYPISIPPSVASHPIPPYKTWLGVKTEQVNMYIGTTLVHLPHPSETVVSSNFTCIYHRLKTQI